MVKYFKVNFFLYTEQSICTALGKLVCLLFNGSIENLPFLTKKEKCISDYGSKVFSI